MIWITRIPRLLRDRIRQRFVFQGLVPSHPLLELNDLQRISGSGQRLREKLIRVKRDRCHERIELIIWNLGRVGLGRCGRQNLRLGRLGLSGRRLGRLGLRQRDRLA